MNGVSIFWIQLNRFWKSRWTCRKTIEHRGDKVGTFLQPVISRLSMACSPSESLTAKNKRCPIHFWSIKSVCFLPVADGRQSYIEEMQKRFIISAFADTRESWAIIFIDMKVTLSGGFACALPLFAGVHRPLASNNSFLKKSEKSNRKISLISAKGTGDFWT